MSRGPLPLAFLLAIAADSTGAAPLHDASAPLVRGTLSGLLPKGLQPIVPPAADRTHEGQVGTRLVQYFPNFPNFRNCIVGSWRNC